MSDEAQASCGIAAVRERVTALESNMQEMRMDLPNMIKTMVKEAISEHGLSPDQKRFVELAIQKEAQSIDLRNAIIKHTTTGLVWLMILGLGSMILEYLRNHGWKP